MKLKGWKKGLAIAGIVLGAIVGLALLAFLIYFLYLEIQYYRIEDGLKLEVENAQTATLSAGEKYSIVTHNVGFGAYEKDYSFFMDSETTLDGVVLKGTHGRALSKENTIRNTKGSLGVVKELNPDFLILQEVDIKSTRSYKVNQVAMYQEAFKDRASIFTYNFHSGYLPVPLGEAHGKSLGGLLSFSKFAVNEAIRHQYPVSKAVIAKFTDLDRCFVSFKVPVSNGKELVIVNSHMSAYDKGGTIREQQLKLLNDFMASEYAKGNYVIVGGDFNHALGGLLDCFPSQREQSAWIFPILDEDLTEHFRIARAENEREVSTCRSCEAPFVKGVNVESNLDGFIVSDNIETVTTHIDAGYLYSDHNPVQMQFVLK